MILTTIIDAVVIFYKASSTYTARLVQDLLLYGTEEADGFHVARIVSTDLKDYLKYGAVVGKVIP